ncbi:MAG: hypothetical protein PVG37_11465, partial [Desulfobacterales bacterium]
VISRFRKVSAGMRSANTVSILRKYSRENLASSNKISVLSKSNRIALNMVRIKPYFMVSVKIKNLT